MANWWRVFFEITSNQMHIAVLITCFNRRDLTLQCLKRLSSQTGVEDVNIETFLVDDGSRDGTGEAIKLEFPAVHLLQGDGSLYWNGGMRMAFAEAMRRGFDAYVFLNDDTLLYPEALNRLISAHLQCLATLGPTIVVGSVVDEKTGSHTYGGHRKSSHGLRMTFIAIPATESLQSCHTMNGNFVLVPASVALPLGNLEANFIHSLGDLDYGLRATKLGIPIRVAPGNMGTCSDNPDAGTWRDKRMSLRRRWKHLVSPKGLPMRDWFLYTRRHFGWRWPLYAVSPYLKTILGM